jgi:predicted nucleotidyltransferase
MDKDAQALVDKFHENHPDRKVVFLIQAGSHFFDLHTEQSDKDFKGIYMPSLEEFKNGEPKRKQIAYKTNPGNKLNKKNTSEDIDFELFSITKFLGLLGKGDFNMIEMLYAPDNKILVNSEYMEYLRHIKSALTVNDISAFLGFIKKEYTRYGVNIYHYGIQDNFLKFLSTYHDHTRLKSIWGDIKKYAEEDSQISFTTSTTGNNHIVPAVKIAQRLYHSTVSVGHIRDAIQRRLDTYGHRQRNMAKDGVEFKGLYHALRLIYEANDLYDYGELRFPLSADRHKMLLSIKTSNIDQKVLFDLIDNEIEKLYDREKEITSNKKIVGETIDKILFELTGKKQLQYVMEKKSCSN